MQLKAPIYFKNSNCHQSNKINLKSLRNKLSNASAKKEYSCDQSKRQTSLNKL